MYGTTALMAAAKNGILKFQNSSIAGFLSNRVFTCAGNDKIIKLLVENNATNINAVDRDGHTALDAVATSIEGKL